MNSSHHIILIFIAILICFILNEYYNSSEKFMLYASTDSIYAPIGIYGINNPQKKIPLNKYANQIAYDLQNPFPQSNTGVNSRVPWNPLSYRDIQESNGQFIGEFSQN